MDKVWLFRLLLLILILLSGIMIGWEAAIVVVLASLFGFLSKAKPQQIINEESVDDLDTHSLMMETNSFGDGSPRISNQAIDVSNAEILQTQSILHNAVENLAHSFQALESKTSEQQRLIRKALDIDESGSTFSEFIAETETLLDYFVSKIITTSKDSVMLMHGLEDMSKKINSVLDLLTSVKGVAAKINLLSLNASIEAARAGMAGRGFSVVANEIRNLSETSRKINEDINQISEEVISTVDSVKEVVNRIAAEDMSKALESQQKVSEMTQHAKRRNSTMETVLAESGGITVEISQSVNQAVTALQFEDMCRQLLERVQLTLEYVKRGEEIPAHLLSEMGHEMTNFQDHLDNKRVQAENMDAGDVELF